MFHSKIQLIRSDTFALNVELSFNEPLIIALYGPSGSGKSTLLRTIAGLEPKANADIKFAGTIYQSSQRHISPQLRPFGYLSQHDDLFPHLTLNQNLLFAERCRKSLDSASDSKSGSLSTPPNSRSKLLSILKLEHLANAHPHNLSQGEKQRARIARAMLQQPKLLLLDEPFVNIDQQSKEIIFNQLKNMVSEWGVPIIFVSHILSEILALSDYLYIMKCGSIVSHGRTFSLLSDLNNPLSGDEQASSLLHVTHANYCEVDQLVEATLGKQSLIFHTPQRYIRENYRIAIPAQSISIFLEKPAACSVLNILSATVLEIKSDGLYGLIRLDIEEQRLIARITSRSLVQLKLFEGQKVFALIKSVAVTTPASC